VGYEIVRQVRQVMLSVHVGRDYRYLIVFHAGHKMHNAIDHLRGFMHTSSSDKGHELEVDTVRHLSLSMICVHFFANSCSILSMGLSSIRSELLHMGWNQKTILRRSHSQTQCDTPPRRQTEHEQDTALESSTPHRTRGSP